jgi:hypothetical protein
MKPTDAKAARLSFDITGSAHARGASAKTLVNVAAEMPAVASPRPTLQTIKPNNFAICIVSLTVDLTGGCPRGRGENGGQKKKKRGGHCASDLPVFLPVWLDVEEDDVEMWRYR